MAIKLSDLLKEDFGSRHMITAKIETGLSIGAAGVGSTLADKPVVKDGRGRFIIPGSHLKGRLRHECEKLARSLGKTACESPRAELMCPQLGREKNEQRARELREQIEKEMGAMPCLVCRIFGNPRTPAAVRVSDLVWEQNAPAETIRNRVAINRRRSTAEEKKLFFIETAPAGAELEFKGMLVALRALTAEERRLLAAALAQIHALGGGKTGGVGWLRLTCDGLI
jgi:CRISPR-associated RAMP protein (TIGR02581 family)